MKNINGLDARIGLRNIVRIVRITSVLSFVALCGATVLPIYHETNNAEAAAGTATAPTLTFASTNAIASVSLSVNDVDGTFATSTEAQKAAFSIATNNYSGYTLSLTASGDTTTLNDNSSHTISSIEYDVSATDFASDTNLNNKWGFIPSHYSSAANTDDYYFPASTSSYSDTLMVTSTANSSNGIDNADNYTIGIGLRADYNTPSGTYTNSTFLIQYVVNPVEYAITYSSDDISGVSGLPASQGGSVHNDTAAESITLSSTIPTRTGYTFAGWCLGVLSDNGTTCTGTTFAAGGEFGIDKTADNTGVTLKALWTINTYSLTVNFTSADVVSVTICTVVFCPPRSVVGIVSVSGGSVSGLEYGRNYYLRPVYVSSEIEFVSWTKNDHVTGSSINSTSTEYTYYTIGLGNGSITITTKLDPCKDETTLYGLVSCRSKGTQTAADLKAVITVPTSSYSYEDTSNSGVYEYDESVFGAAADSNKGDNTRAKIYYYRGILDSNLDGTSDTYGSNGDGAYYPNYVKLGSTCWRIFRTTASGGVKMIYNGIYYENAKSGTCARAQADAQISTGAFDGSDSAEARQVVRVGYTHNSTYAISTNHTAKINAVFGSDSNYGVNNTDSNIKNYLENTWFMGLDGVGAYESMLESNAGYCNDRTVYDNTAPYTQLDGATTDIETLGGASAYNFGAYVRNKVANGTHNVTLSCARSTVDLYTTSSAGVGNGQLNKPVALITADELSLSGSGGNGGSSVATMASNYNVNSFMRSGSDFWSLSPYRVDSYPGLAEMGVMDAGGTINYTSANFNLVGIRPVISFVDGTTIASGSGTATDPWVVAAP